MSLISDPILRVALPVPLSKLFDYKMPQGAIADESTIGCRVRVTLGKRRLIGVVVAIGPLDPSMSLKEAEELLDSSSIFTPELWASLVWAADYYHHPTGEVLATALPALLRRGKPVPDTRESCWTLTAVGRERRSTVRRGSRLRAVLDALAENPLDVPHQSTPAIRATLRQLERRGLIASVHVDAREAVASRTTCPHVLSEPQRAAIDRVKAALGSFAVNVLDGVTGSGKTEVYIGAIEACLAQGRQALVLVPEIGLTPQALRRYGERLPVPVHAMHSGLGDAERMRSWAAMARGDGRVLVGTRSAVFTPLPDAGLIVIDEEHDASYKQHEGFRYHARDFALVRAKALRVPVILGSATPALETLRHARTGRYGLIRLSSRAGVAKPPDVHVVDIRRSALTDGLSASILAATARCLERGEQAMVFRNRRGYAPALMCHDCGWTAICPRCDTSMTLHGRVRLLCHHCGSSGRSPGSCPECSGLAVLPLGVGTERLEAGLRSAFPDVPVVRVDRDTTQRRGAMDQHLATLGNQPGILIGTQILAKGHDLPLLTLVAIASIDEGLFSADFRAAERLAQLLIQVSGRAGRAARPGEIWLQTHHPEHPLLRTLLSGGYPEFATLELAAREDAGFPPYSSLALIRAEASDEEKVRTFLLDARVAFGAPADVSISPPIPAPMARRAGMHRAQMLLTSPQRRAIQSALRQGLPQLRGLASGRRVRWSIDVDPIDLY